MSKVCSNCETVNETNASVCMACSANLAADVIILPDEKPGEKNRRLRLAVLIPALAAAAYAGRRYVKPDELGRARDALRAEYRRIDERKKSSEEKSAAKAREEETAAAAAARRARHWVISGKVYDLITLKPIPDVRITFRSVVTGKDIVASSNGSGTFSAELPKTAGGGYKISVHHKKYGTIYSEEGYTPYPMQDLERRQEERETLLSMPVMHVPILPPMEDPGYDLNIVMTR